MGHLIMQNWYKSFHVPKWVWFLMALLVMIRLSLPFVCLKLINDELSHKLGAYTGHLKDFDLSLYRGAYQLQGLEIKKNNSALPPLLQIKEIDLSLAWRALLRGEITGDITLTNMKVQLADGAKAEQMQFGTEEKMDHWQKVFDLLIPMHIESFKVIKSAIYFANSDIQPSLPVRLENIEFSATDIRTKAQDKTSPFYFSGLAQGHAPLWAGGYLDILSTPPKIDMDFKLTKFRLNTLNKILRLYVPLDITKGSLTIYGEVARVQESAKGYMKIFFKDGDIIAPKQKYVSVKHFFIEIITALGNWILKNNQTKKVAAYIPFEYRRGKLNVDSTKAFWSALKNSYDQLKPDFDNSIGLNKL